LTAEKCEPNPNHEMVELFKDVLHVFSGRSSLEILLIRVTWPWLLVTRKGTPEGTAGMLFSHFLPKLALLLKTDLAGEKVLQQGGQGIFLCANNV
jgi:hypothetical protein